MTKCVDFWCEHYGNSSYKCELCEKKELTQDKPELRVILKRRADKQMEIANLTKKRGQTR